MTRKKQLVRIGLGALVLLAAVGTWAAMNATALKAKYAARQLRTATTDDERARAADKLIGLGEHGLAKLVEFVRAGDEPCRAAAVGALDRHLTALPDVDPWANVAAERLLNAFTACDVSGQRAILELLPALLKRTGNTHAVKCRDVIATGLTAPDSAARLLSIRLALHPEVKLRAEVVRLLSDTEAEVRRAALVAVGTDTDGEVLVSDEDLFRWLHDPDEGVRKLCRDALVSRDRTEVEIRFGGRLTNPDARERLKLLLDLQYDDDLADPEPWLERLSRDIEPAVRAGAARAAVELTSQRRLGCPQWVSRVAEADPDPTVRLIARYFQSVPLRAATGELRPIGGP